MSLDFMSIPQPFKYSVSGFSAKRVGYALVVANFALLPAHFQVSCEVSGEIAGIGIILFLITLLLSIFIPRGTPDRFRPLRFAMVALVAHMVCQH